MDGSDQTNISVTVKNYGYNKGVSTALHAFFLKKDEERDVNDSEKSMSVDTSREDSIGQHESDSEDGHGNPTPTGSTQVPLKPAKPSRGSLSKNQITVASLQQDSNLPPIKGAPEDQTQNNDASNESIKPLQEDASAF